MPGADAVRQYLRLLYKMEKLMMPMGFTFVILGAFLIISFTFLDETAFKTSTSLLAGITLTLLGILLLGTHYLLQQILPRNETPVSGIGSLNSQRTSVVEGICLRERPGSTTALLSEAMERRIRRISDSTVLQHWDNYSL